ncbi:hypothetical protein [Burkholderia arboris]|uniref:hypothetical protein n=1 Tax=Burkholderia arboris TaxID=488730 RepID=UPI00158BFD6F|nr:hypothetical protein [Burkholderia arboris]
MNKPNLPNLIKTLPLFGVAKFLDCNLNPVIERDGQAVRPDGLNLSFLGLLDRIVLASLETELPPFRVRGDLYSKRIREWDETGQQLIVSQPAYAKKASPNSAFHGADCLVTRLLPIKDWPSSHPAANMLCFPPHLRLLFDVYFDHPICRNRQRDLNACADGTDRSVAEVYNDFVDQFRRAVCASKGLRRALHNWCLSSRENAINLGAYLDELFAQCSSLTALHFRLLHTSAPVEDPHYALPTLRACRTKLLDRMRSNPALFTNNPGCVWAVLPTLDGRYDLHLTLLLDTAALQKLLGDKRVEAERASKALADYADLVGAYWVGEITGGQGRYFRADQNGVLYGRDWVHGEIAAGDIVRRGKLKQTLEYLAMRRALVRLRNEPPGPYFGLFGRGSQGERRSR